MNEEFDHGFPDNPYNKHSWIIGKPEIGDRVWIGAFTLIDAGYAPLSIGRGTDISSGVQILTHSTVRRAISEKRYGEIDFAPTEIGEFCFIGTHATILMGSTIGHHSIVAAGAVVPQFMKVPPYSMVAGVPAKIIGSSKKILKNVDNESLSIVIPSFNEEKNIERVVKEAIDATAKITKDYEIVLVNDGSTDKTGKVIDALAKKNKKLRVFHHKKNKGFTGAMKTSLYSAKKNLVFLAPGDGQFDFNQLSKFVDAIRGYDMAIGYKTNSSEGLLRKLSSWAIYYLYRKLFNIPIREISSVFLWRRRVIESIEVVSDDRSAMFLYEFFFKALTKKYKYVEVPITWRNRRSGIAKGRGLKNIVKTLKGMAKLWFSSIIKKR